MEAEERMCWICHLTDEDQPALTWISPCGCRGSTKWVHQRCLLRWINNADPACGGDRMCCPNGCGVQYTLAEGSPSMLVQLGDLVNEGVERSVPMMSLAMLLTTVWAGLACYSALTIATVTGRIGVRALIRADPGIAYLALPMLPLGLIACRGAFVLPQSAEEQDGARAAGDGRAEAAQLGEGDQAAGGDEDWNDEWVTASRPHSFSRVAVGGLMFPYLAYGTGRLCFGRARDGTRLLHTIVGGIVFLVGKSVAKKVYRHYRLEQLTTRRILDHSRPEY